jgi:hypothetical protein
MLTHETLARITAITPHVDAPALTLSITQQTKRTLAQRHFRGREVARAGNFKRWRTVDACVKTIRPDIERHTIETLRKMLCEGHDEAIDSFELDMPYPVGWDTIAALSEIDQQHFEVRSIRGHEAVAWFFHLNSPIRAPLTRIMTVVYRIHRERRSTAWTCTILTIRPGPDLGVLKGNVTEQFGIALFDWEHPGVKP